MENRVEFKNHPIIMVKAIGTAIVFILIMGTNALIELKEILFNPNTYSEFGENWHGLVVALLLIFGFTGLIVLGQFLRWRNTRIFLDNEHIYYEYKGIFRRIKKQVSFQNVSSVNTKASLFDKIFGVCQVQLDINSSRTASQADYKIVLSNTRAAQFKQMVDTAKNEIIVNQVKVENQTNVENLESHEGKMETYAFSLGMCLRHAFLSGSIASLGWFVCVMIFTLFSVVILGNLITGISIIIIGVIPMIAEFGKSIFRFMNFTTKRSGDSIYLSYGLVSTQTYIIPVKNIVSVGIVQSFIAKITGFMCVEVNTIGIGNENNELTILSVYLSKEDIAEFSQKIIPEFNLIHDFVKQSPKVFFYKSIVRSVLFVVIALGISYIWGYWWLVLAVLGPILGIITAFLEYASFGMKVIEDSIVLKRGFFSTRTMTIKQSRIDQMVLKQNIIQRLLKLEKLQVKSRGKKGKETHGTGYYQAGTFSQAVVAFRE